MNFSSTSFAIIQSISQTRGLLILSTLFISFLFTNTSFAQNAREEVPFTTILKVANSRIAYSLDRVIYTDLDWQNFWNELHANFQPVPPLPLVDFSQKMVIVAAMGLQPTPGHRITITSLVSVKNMLRVEIEETEPGRECSPLEATSRPIHIVEAERQRFITFRRTIARPKCVQ